MTRKQWLEKFLWLADQNRPAREYRSTMGISFVKLKIHIAALQAYREELAEIVSVEAAEKVMVLNKIKLKKALKEKKEKEDKKEENSGRKGRGRSRKSEDSGDSVSQVGNSKDDS